MKLNWIDQLGDGNPQLFRELKGRLTTRNLAITIVGSVVSQFLVFLSCSQQKCLSVVDGKCIQFYWQIHWQIIFKGLNWILPLMLLVGGIYLLIDDIAQEERRGTLNFIRLSPQSSQSILLGKMLGVAALVYLAVVLAVPLHLVSALATGLPFFWILGIYTLWFAGCCLFYSIALLYTLGHSAQIDAKSLAGGGSLLSFFFGCGYISAIDFSFDWYRSGGGDWWQWFFLPIARQPILLYGLTFISISVATYWYWQAINRRFRNPKATLISKQQSYWLVTSFELWLLGFSLSSPNSVSSVLGFPLLFVVTPLFFLQLIFALAPGRQALLDWARYRRENINNRQGFWKRFLVQDLIWAEKSPTIVAIAFNLLITAAIWSPWILLLPKDSRDFGIYRLLLGLLVTMSVLLLYAAIADLLQLVKPQNRPFWIVGTVSVIFLSLVSLGLLGQEALAIQLILLFLPFPALPLVFGSVTIILLGILSQFTVLGLLSLQLTRQLRKAGESNSKALLTGN